MSSFKELINRLQSVIKKNDWPPLELNPGVSVEEIEAAEKTIGLKFPEELKEYFLTFNGEDFSKYEGLEYGGFPWLPDVAGLSSLKDIVEAWKEEQEWMEDNEFEGFEYYCNEKIRWEYWHDHRIPIAFGAFSEGDIVYVDLTPGPKGTSGQIILRPHGMAHQLIDVSLKNALER